MPAGAYLTARVLHAGFVGFLLVAITVAFGVVVYGAHLPAAPDLLRFILTLLVGAGCFAAIGLAVSGIVPNEDAGPPIVNAVILPLLFLSGVFFTTEGAPEWVVWVGRIFPVKHLVDAMRASYLGPALPLVGSAGDGHLAHRGRARRVSHVPLGAVALAGGRRVTPVLGSRRSVW